MLTSALSITDYIIAQVILAFWLVIAYDLLEERARLTSSFQSFPLWFLKLRKVFLIEALNRYEKNEEERKSRLREILEHKIGLEIILKPLLCVEFNKPKKQNCYIINLFKQFNFSQSQNNCWHRLMSGMKHQNITFLKLVHKTTKYRARTQIFNVTNGPFI